MAKHFPPLLRGGTRFSVAMPIWLARSAIHSAAYARLWTNNRRSVLRLSHPGRWYRHFPEAILAPRR